MRPTYGFYSWSVNLSRVRVRVRVTRDSQYVYDYLALLERGRLLSFIIFLIVWFVRSQAVSWSGPILTADLFSIRRIPNFSLPLIISIGRRVMRWLISISMTDHSVTKAINRCWAISIYLSLLVFRIKHLASLWHLGVTRNFCQSGQHLFLEVSDCHFYILPCSGLSRKRFKLLLRWSSVLLVTLPPLLQDSMFGVDWFGSFFL